MESITSVVTKSLSDKADILQGKLYTQGEADDSQEVNKLNLFINEQLEKFTTKLATSGILNDGKIDPHEEKLVEHFVKRDLLNPLIEKIKQAENIAHGDKTVQAIESGKQQLKETAQSVIKNYPEAVGLITLGLFAEEVAQLGAWGGKKLLDFIRKGQNPPDIPRRPLPGGNHLPLGDRTDRMKAILEEAKERGDKVYEATKELIEDVDKTIKRMPKKGMGPLDIIETGKHVIEKKLDEIYKAYGEKVFKEVVDVFGKFAKVAKTGLKALPIVGPIVVAFIDGHAQAKELQEQMKNVVKFEGNYYQIQEEALNRYGLTIRNGELEVKDLRKFEPLAKELRLDPLTDYPGGKLSPEAEKKIIQKFGAPWEPGLGNLLSPF